MNRVPTNLASFFYMAAIGRIEAATRAVNRGR